MAAAALLLRQFRTRKQRVVVYACSLHKVASRHIRGHVRDMYGDIGGTWGDVVGHVKEQRGTKIDISRHVGTSGTQVKIHGQGHNGQRQAITKN